MVAMRASRNAMAMYLPCAANHCSVAGVLALRWDWLTDGRGAGSATFSGGALVVVDSLTVSAVAAFSREVNAKGNDSSTIAAGVGSADVAAKVRGWLSISGLVSSS